MEIKYYYINEAAARRAHEMNSYYDYIDGSTTADYRTEVDNAAKIAEDNAERRPQYAAEIAGLLDSFSRRLADWYNENSRIEALCPSVLITGGSNFPVTKKARQNAARSAHAEKYQSIWTLTDKMRTIGTGGIKSDDPEAVEKLTCKLDGLKRSQEAMKAINAYYRKNKTLDGCTAVSAVTLEKIKSDMTQSWHLQDAPFASFELSNNNSEIHRLESRIAELQQHRTAETTEADHDGKYKVVENTEIDRLQVIFDGKPATEVRDVLKSNGFKWAPSQGAWQRQLTANAKYALCHYVTPEIDRLLV